MKLNARFFTLREFTTSQTAVRRGIDNTPTEEHIKAMNDLCRHILDPLRSHLGRPVIITSGYRSPALNKAIGGAKNSQHALGQAADIVVPGMSVDEVIQNIVDLGLPYDQMIHEFGSWVHISYGPRQRRQALKAARSRWGRTQYSPLAVWRSLD